MSRARGVGVGCGAIVALVVGSAGGAPAEPPAGCEALVDPGQELSPLAADRLRLSPGTTRGDRVGELKLRDGRILVQREPGEAGRLYEPAAFRAHGRALAERDRRRGVHDGDSYHPLHGLIDDGASFAARVPALAGAFAHRLEREHLAVDPRGIEAWTARFRAAGCRLDAAPLRELTATLGELLIRRGPPRARWSTRVGSGGQIEPVIELPAAASASGAPEARVIAPWPWALRLLTDGADGAIDLERTLAEAVPAPAALTAPPPGGPAPTRPRELPPGPPRL